jgi:ATP-dependent Lon protease
MNILTVGGQRYRILRYINTLPYLKAQVELLEDEPEEQDPLPVMAEIRKLYDRASTALRELNEEQGLPEELPEAAEEFSFVIAGTLQLEPEVKQQLLELRSVSARLQRVRRYLTKVLEEYEIRAGVHARAKKNGHSHHAKEILEQLGRLQDE